MNQWTPNMDIGTWHPQGWSRWYGHKRYEQRVNGQPTGLYFWVSHWRYWWIEVLSLATLVGVPGAQWFRSRMLVEYRYRVTGPRGQA